MKRLALALALATAVTTPAVAGSPWITIEVRPNGLAFVIARTFHHGTPSGLPLSGTAEGLVNGQRRTMALRFDTTAEANAFGVPRTWSEEGVWVLNIGTAAEHGGAGAVVGIDRSGTLAFVRFPRNYQGSSRVATSAEIETLLRALDSGRQPPLLSGMGLPGVLRTAGPVLLLGLLALLAVRLGTVIVRRVKAVRGRAVTASASMLLVAVLAAVPAIAGAPWISVELPANPMDPATRGGFAVVHTYRHADPMPFVVTGSAEGLVSGQRRSVPMRLNPTGTNGRMVIMKNWSSDGVWVLKLGVDGMDMGAAIGVGADGEVAFVRVPMTRSGGPRSLTTSEVEGMLRSLAAGERVPALAATR